MHHEQVRGRIHIVIEKLKMMFPELTVQDLHYEYNRKEEFYKRLGKRLGCTHEEVAEILTVILNETVNEEIMNN